MFGEDDLLPISALAHLFFCQRRAALIHIEGVWDENVFTAEGRILHEAAHEPALESRGDLRIARGLRLRSLRLGLSGKADVVEFHRRAQADSPPATEGGVLPTRIQLPGVDGFWQPFPVEYKRGRLRREEGYEVQLCAQALCLEEMLTVAVPVGAVFYGQPRKRLEVAFGEQLRRETETAAARLHELIQSRNTPPARYEKKCESCSLLTLCMPKTTTGRKSVDRYLAAMLEYDAG
jgi:CRISPR-associated exonuclease Cas4